MSEPVFIKLLEYGEQVSLNATTWEECRAWMLENRHIMNNQDEISRLHVLFQECFETSLRMVNQEQYILKTEYYFRLIEYRELAESRIASKSANRNALWAISISVIAIIVSIFASYIQISTPVSVDPNQFNSAINALKNTDATSDNPN